MNSFDVASQVNHRVNSDTTYRSDMENHGVLEDWEDATPGGFEDCDGYALAKRTGLRLAGWPQDQQYLARCYIGTEGHLVLLVETDRGVFVMDNNSTELKPPSWTGYRWHSALRGKEWCAISIIAG